MEIKIKQQLVKYWFSILQDIICLEVENLEKEYGSKIKFKVGSEMIEKTLPLNNERVPAGNYEGVIVNPLLGTERKIRFKVEENKRNFLK